MACSASCCQISVPDPRLRLLASRRWPELPAPVILFLFNYVLEVQFSKINSAEVHLSTRGGFAFCFFDIFSVLFVILNVNSILCESIYTAGLSGQT